MARKRMASSPEEAKEQKAAAAKPVKTAEEKAAAKEEAKQRLAEAREKAAAEREVKKAEKAKAQEKTEAGLVTVAKEVNVRFEKAAKLDADADDHRLAAALKLAEAKKKCEDVGLSFKEWAEKNITAQSFRTIRQLADIGVSGVKETAALKLADLRNQNKEANKKHREGKKTGGGSSGPKAKPATPLEALDAAVAGIPDAKRAEVVSGVVKKLGLVAVTPEEAKVARAGAGANLLDRAKAAFEVLTAPDKLALAKWAADKIGGKFVSPFDVAEKPAGDADPFAIPAALKREKSK